MNTKEYNEIITKLAVNIANTNNEGIIRANADALLTGRLNALEKVTAEDFAELSDKYDLLKAEIAALKAQNDAVALAYEVASIKSVLTQLIQALDEEIGDDGADDDGHSLEQVKAAYLKLVANDETPDGLALIGNADTATDNGETYRLINSTAGTVLGASQEPRGRPAGR